jgi:hypothetical protein
MRRRFDPRLEVLPAAQQYIWPKLAAAPSLSFVLYGGTAVALHCGHRQSEDFDFFRHDNLDLPELQRSFRFFSRSEVLEEEENTLVISTKTPKGAVKVSFFGGLRFGRVRKPLETRDGVLLIASRDDLLVTKLKAILGRAEAKDYTDIAELLRSGTSLETALAAFKPMFGGEPATVLRAIGYFEDGNVGTISKRERKLLKEARDAIVHDLPSIRITRGSLAGR